METDAWVIEDDDLSLPDPRLRLAQTNVIRARRIVIAREVNLAACAIALYAQEVRFEPDGIIDTSGKPASRDFPEGERIDGASTGDAGRDGDFNLEREKLIGQNGGDIRIWAEQVTGIIRLKANGGRGGRGRDGGNGQHGQSGIAATGELKGTAHPGSAGSSGGAGGKAGTSGNGGDGGIIDVAVINRESFMRVEQARLSSTLESRAGQGGAAARGGAGGPGGAGGAGGSFGHYEEIPGPTHHGGDGDPQPPRYRYVQDGVGPNGPAGPAGTGGAGGKSGLNGCPGIVQVRQIEHRDLAGSATVTHLTLLTRKGEASYRNADLTTAAAILGYVYRLAGARQG
jgi:hypothetical protein